MTETTKYIILPTQPEDAEAVRACGQRAFGPVSFQGFLFPESRKHLTPLDEVAKWRADRLRKMLKADDILHFKCVPEDDHSKVIGYSVWHKPGHFKNHGTADSVVGEPDAAKPPALVKQDDDTPAAMDMEAYKYVTRTIDEQRTKIWGDETNFWYLGGLSIDPDYQGRGLARKLIDMGLVWADHDDLPTYLESTPEASKVYPRFGFEKVGEYGFFDGQYPSDFFIRQPHATKPTVVELGE